MPDSDSWYEMFELIHRVLVFAKRSAGQNGETQLCVQRTLSQDIKSCCSVSFANLSDTAMFYFWERVTRLFPANPSKHGILVSLATCSGCTSPFALWSWMGLQQIWKLNEWTLTFNMLSPAGSDTYLLGLFPFLWALNNLTLGWGFPLVIFFFQIVLKYCNSSQMNGLQVWVF